MNLVNLTVITRMSLDFGVPEFSSEGDTQVACYLAEIVASPKLMGASIRDQQAHKCIQQLFTNNSAHKI